MRWISARARPWSGWERAATGRPRHVDLRKQARALHAAATQWKELDSNPFYEKYKNKLDKVHG